MQAGDDGAACAADSYCVGSSVTTQPVELEALQYACAAATAPA